MTRVFVIAWAWLTIGFGISAALDVRSWNAGRCGIGNDGIIVVTVGWPVLLPGAFLAVATGHRFSEDAIRRHSERGCR